MIILALGNYQTKIIKESQSKNAKNYVQIVNTVFLYLGLENLCMINKFKHSRIKQIKKERK